MFALALGTLPEDFLLQPDRLAADVAQRTDQWQAKPFAPAQGLSAASARRSTCCICSSSSFTSSFATASFGGGAPPMTRERRVEAMRGNC